jgi:hypothetical protein
MNEEQRATTMARTLGMVEAAMQGRVPSHDVVRAQAQRIAELLAENDTLRQERDDYRTKWEAAIRRLAEFGDAR